MIMSTTNNFITITRIDSLVPEELFECAIVYSEIYDLSIICIYRAPDADVFLFQNILSLLDSVPINCKLTICGSFNIDFHSGCVAFFFETFWCSHVC